MRLEHSRVCGLNLFFFWPHPPSTDVGHSAQHRVCEPGASPPGASLLATGGLPKGQRDFLPLSADSSHVAEGPTLPPSVHGSPLARPPLCNICAPNKAFRGQGVHRPQAPGPAPAHRTLSIVFPPSLVPRFKAKVGLSPGGRATPSDVPPAPWSSVLLLSSVPPRGFLRLAFQEVRPPHLFSFPVLPSQAPNSPAGMRMTVPKDRERPSKPFFLSIQPGDLRSAPQMPLCGLREPSYHGNKVSKLQGPTGAWARLTTPTVGPHLQP